MIVWVVALRPEAAPLIAGRNLEAVKEPTPWPVYRREDGEVLVITGIGRNAAAAACGWLQGHLATPRHTGWLNAGIAGHSIGPMGRGLLASRVIEMATGRSWYPPPLPGVDGPGVSLVADTLYTVDQPESEFSKSGAYDMEASGFLAAVGRWVTAEMAQVVKVVSDHPAAPASGLDRRSIHDLIEARLSDFEAVAEALTEAGASLALRAAAPPGYTDLIEGRHFTVTQRRQLRRLLERFAALAQDDQEREIPAVCFTPTSDARTVLRLLAEQVDTLAVET